MAFLDTETYEKVSQDAMKLAAATAVKPQTQPSISPPAYKPPDALSDGLGHWWDSTTQSWQNDSGGAYQEPAPTTWNLPPSLASLPKDTLPSTPQPFQSSYNLPPEPQFSPWDSTPGSIVGYGETFTPNWDVMTTPEEQGGGGFFGGLKSAAGAVGGGIADFAGDYVDVLQKNRPSGSVMGLGSVPGNTREATPGDFLEGAELMTSGNAIANKFGYHPEDLPYGLGYVTDAINPATIATIAAGPTVPLLGSTFSGGLAKRAVGEVAVNAAGMAAGAKGAEKAAEYTDNPWLIGGAGVLTGLAGAGGVIGAVGAAKRAPGAVKAADRALQGVDAKLMEPGGSRLVTAGSSAEPRIPGELRAGPTMDEATKAATTGRAAGSPSTLTDQELVTAIRRADDMVRQADTRAADLVRSQGPKDADTVAANRALTALEDDAERLRDEAVRRGGIATLASKLNDETGALDMGAVGDMAKAAKPYLAPVAREAGRVAGHAAVGAGVGAATGAYASDGDLEATLRGAAIGAAGGVALRGVAGVAGKAASKGVTAKAAARNAALGVPDAPPATAKLIEIIKAAKPARASAEELKSQALRTKAAKLHGVYGSNTGEAAFSRAPSALGGDLPKGQFDAPRPSFTQEDVDSLFNHIAANPLVAGKNKERVFTVFNTQGALFKALAGELPTNGEIQLLEKAFGPELAKALLGKRSLGAKAMSAALDAINMPRSLITAIDASAPLRQGALLVPGHPITSIKAAGTMVRAMASPEYAKYVDEGIAASPNMPVYEKMGLYFAPNSATSPISAREEGIASRLAGKLPGVGGSQRGYTTYLNKVRQDLADNWIKTLSPEELKDDTMLRQMGDWLNVASGRGKLPPAADRIVSVSSGAFFAPRYAISRIQVPIEAVRAVNPLSGLKGDVRKEIARDLVSFVGTGVGVLALGKAAGFWEAEMDPRSTDFGKIRIGPTRWDMWAGEQQIARTVAQLASGQRKSTSTGDIIPTDRSDTMLRWLRSKASPAASAAWDLGEGKTFIGEELNADKPTIGKQAFQRLMPLFIQGVTEAWMEDGWKAGARAGAGVTGIGVQTYFTNRDVQNRVADEMFGKPYLDLTKGERDLVKADPRMVEQAAAFSDSAKVDPSQFFDRKDEFYGQLEADFRTKVEAGMEGKALKDAVSDLKGDRWTASQALLGSEAVQKVLKSGTPNSQIIDALAESYWSAPVAEDPKTGELDFASRDAERAKIVQQVKDAGLDMNYITGTGLGTFRGERFKDPVVRDAVLKVEAQTEMLETSGYWSLKDDAWAKIQTAKVPGTTGFKDYYEWRDAMQTKVAGQIEAAGESKDFAMEEAERLVAKMDAAKVQSDIVKVVTSKWVIEHPEAAVTAWRLDYFNPGKENGQEAFLNDWIKKHPEYK